MKSNQQKTSVAKPCYAKPSVEIINATCENFMSGSMSGESDDFGWGDDASKNSIDEDSSGTSGGDND